MDGKRTKRQRTGPNAGVHPATASASTPSASPADAPGSRDESTSVVEQLQGNAVDLSKMALGEGGTDVGKVVEWMRSIPSTLTRLKIDVPNASAEVVDALHSLVAKTTTLAELDAMEGSASKLNVLLRLNGAKKVKRMDLSSERLGPVSAAIIAACVQHNPVLESLQCAAARPRRVFAPQRDSSTPTLRSSLSRAFAFLSAPIDTPRLSQQAYLSDLSCLAPLSASHPIAVCPGDAALASTTSRATLRRIWPR